MQGVAAFIHAIATVRLTICPMRLGDVLEPCDRMALSGMLPDAPALALNPAKR